MRVYFLGAGASKSFYCSLPTAAELTLERLLDPDSYEPGRAPCDAISQLRLFASEGKICQSRHGQPLEEILEVFGGKAHAYRSLQFCLVRRLWTPDIADTSLLKKWLQSVQRNGDVIITTNYDTVLERGISKLTNSPDSRPLGERGLLNFGVSRDLLKPDSEMLASDPQSITLLKLHGSISWSYCANCHRATLHPVYRDGASDSLAGYACACGCELSPILVGPAQKQYEHPVIAGILRSAKAKLQQASEIIFVGFSMNSGDCAIRRLVTEAHDVARSQNVSVVDRQAKDLESVYASLYGGRTINLFAMDWQGYIKSHVPTGIELA